MTPYEIELLLWYYYTPIACPKPRNDLFYSTMKHFVDRGLILKGPQIQNGITDSEYDKEFHGNADALKVYVDALAAVPLPVQKWIV